MTNEDKDKDNIIANLQNEIAMLKSVLYTIPGNIYWKTKDDRFLGCNENVAKIFKLNSPDEIIGKTGKEIIKNAELAEKTRQVDLEVLEQRNEVSYEEIGIDANGKRVTYLSRKSPFYDINNNLIGIIGISVDITHQKTIEKKLKKARQIAEVSNRAKSKFLSMASHELRIPLTCILGFSRFLENCSSELERKKYLDQLIRSSNYLLALVNNLLDFSKLEAGKETISLTTVNIRQLVTNIVLMQQANAKEKKLNLNLEYDDAITDNVLTDPNILQQILMNLVSNAIKFTHHGNVTIKMNLLKKSEEEVKLEISVCDTGIGIPTNKLNSIFDEFYQVDDIYKRQESITGTGLGLAIVKKLIKLLGGKIQVQSKLNEGSIFSFLVPFKLPQKNSAPLSLIENKLKMDFPVLLIEDDPSVQFIHGKMLMDLGCQVDKASDGVSALKMIHKNYPIIFVDIGLPDITGFELIKKLKKLIQAKSNIVALTGFFSKEEKKRCLKLGAREVLIKPVSPDLLRRVLQDYM